MFAVLVMVKDMILLKLEVALLLMHCD